MVATPDPFLTTAAPRNPMQRIALALAATSLIAGTAFAAPVSYTIDPAHTYPSFEADHMGGLSTWRGKFNASSGKVVYDKEGKTGSVEVSIDTKSLDFGHDGMNEHAKGPDMFDVAKFPTATYKGTLAGFQGDAPTEVQGQLTLHGVTKPVTLKVNSFLCKMNPMVRKEVCGADATAQISREDFGIAYGKAFGFKMDVTLRVSIEAVRD
jgi:polyisoprenoid-binding protein YceI